MTFVNNMSYMSHVNNMSYMSYVVNNMSLCE